MSSDFEWPIPPHFELVRESNARWQRPTAVRFLFLTSYANHVVR